MDIPPCSSAISFEMGKLFVILCLPLWMIRPKTGYSLQCCTQFMSFELACMEVSFVIFSKAKFDADAVNFCNFGLIFAEISNTLQLYTYYF